MLPFCSKNSGPILITSWSCEKRYQTLPTYISFRSGVGEPGNEAKYSESLLHAAIPGEKR